MYDGVAGSDLSPPEPPPRHRSQAVLSRPDACAFDARGFGSVTSPSVETSRFIRIDAKRVNAEPHGVGLGLAISRELAVAMSGDIRVVSTLGQGSTFTLTLPLHVEARSTTGSVRSDM